MRTGFVPAALMASGLLLTGCVDEPSTPDTATAVQADADHDHGHDHGHAHDHDHDHGDGHEAPETFAAAVAELAEMRDTIKSAMADNDLETADGPVHALGRVLEHLDGLAAKAELTEEQLATVESAKGKLFETFGALDDTIHGKESGKSWEEVGDEINAAIASLQGIGSSDDSDASDEADEAEASGETEGTEE